MMNKTILVTGGAGYIGSHTAFLLQKLGYKIVIIDKFVYDQSFDVGWANVIRGDIADEALLNQIFSDYKIDSVVHFAASIEVGESVKNPKLFYENNVINTIKLLNAMLAHGVKKIIFSSSCAVYGNPIKVPMDETHTFAPVSPYGKNKLMVEYLLQDYDVAYGLKYVALRYFNASGALSEEGLGERHDPETHIIPLLLRAAMQNKKINIFGNDYNTPDGTCIRDYVHVLDIAQAHVQALQFLADKSRSDVFNLGSENGYSVLQLIQIVKKELGLNVELNFAAKRPGDAEVLVADASKAKNILGWNAKHSSLSNIIKTAFDWESKRW